MLDLFDPDRGRITGIDRAVFEAIAERVDRLAIEAEVLRAVIDDRHAGEVAAATVDEWRGSAKLVYELARASLQLEVAALGVHAGSVRALYETAGAVIGVERAAQFG